MNTNDLINNLTKDTSAIKLAPRPFMVLFTWLLAVIFYITIFIYINDFRSDIATKIHDPIFITDIILSIIIIFSSASTANLSAYPDLSRNNIYSKITLISIACLLILMIWQSFTLPSDTNSIQINHFSCATFMCLFGALPATGLFLLLSRGICFTPSKTALSAGVASFMTGYLTLRLEEAQDSPVHIWLYHMLPLVIMITITYIIIKTLLKKY